MSRLSGEGLNGDNDEAISEQVSNAWRVIGKRLLTEGYDPALVTETMLTVALKSWVGLRTRPDAVRDMELVGKKTTRRDTGYSERAPRL